MAVDDDLVKKASSSSTPTTVKSAGEQSNLHDGAEQQNIPLVATGQSTISTQTQTTPKTNGISTFPKIEIPTTTSTSTMNVNIQESGLCGTASTTLVGISTPTSETTTTGLDSSVSGPQARSGSQTTLSTSNRSESDESDKAVSDKDSAATRSLKSVQQDGEDDEITVEVQQQLNTATSSQASTRAGSGREKKKGEMKKILTSVSSLLTSGSQKSNEQLELGAIALDSPSAVFSELFQLTGSSGASLDSQSHPQLHPQLSIPSNNNNNNGHVDSNSEANSSATSIPRSFEWKEIARWVKYEENVEENGTRWSKPYVSTVSLAAFDAFKRSLEEGLFILDSPATSLEGVVDEFVNLLRIRQNPDESVVNRIVADLLAAKRHQFQQKRTLLSSIHDLRQTREHNTGKVSDVVQSANSTSSTNGTETITTSATERAVLPPVKINGLVSQNDNSNSRIIRSQSNNVLAPISTNHGALSSSTAPQAKSQAPLATKQDESSLTKNSYSTSHLPKLQFSTATRNDNSGQFKPNKAFRKKIPHNAVGNSILVAEVDYLTAPISGFIRLLNAVDLGDLSEVSIPTKFIYINLSPRLARCKNPKEKPQNVADSVQIGRALGTLMADPVFREVSLKGRSVEAFVGAIDDFLGEAPILPPNLWDPNTRIEPPEKNPSSAQQMTRRINSHALMNSSQDALEAYQEKDSLDWTDSKKKEAEISVELDSDEEEEIERVKMGLVRTGRMFGGLINDVKRRLPHYKSDFTDAFALQSVASVIFLYFACLTPIITFGGLLADATGNNIATMESLVCGALCGIVYGFFSGQPLTILGSTGPVLVFETIVYDFCSSHGFNYLGFRFWIGMWTAAILLLFVAFDSSYMVCYITRFTEENFASLISVIFIVSAISKLMDIEKQYPVNRGAASLQEQFDCECQLPNSSLVIPASTSGNNSVFSACVQNGGVVFGRGCNSANFEPDVYFFSVILFVFTFILSTRLKSFRYSRYLSAGARELISDFSVPIAISSMTLLDIYWGIATPKLNVPEKFEPTSSERGWLVEPFAEQNPTWLIFFALFPALLATILIFMDQQITAVIINRKENLLKKGCGYHLDLFVLCILIAICSLFGLPWFVAATVLSITHVNSLTMFSESSAPGDKPIFLGVREQRLTQIMIFVFCGLSIFFTPILRRIPMPVLYGVFLYMGISSLHGSQFLNRLLIIFMPAKYQPDYIFLRRVPILRIHMFTLIQFVCFVFLWTVKSVKQISIIFPLMLLVILTVRKLLDYVFTRQEMKILDDTMPESKRKKKEKRKAKIAAAEAQKLQDIIMFSAGMTKSDAKKN